MSRPDLDNIVRSPSAKTFLRMVTKGFYDNSYTGLWMYEVIGREWDEMREWSEGLKNEIHPQTCTWSIGIWEWVYGFESDETLSLESRRQRIIAKVISTRPINPEAIRNGVAKITGCDVDIKDFAGPYRFSLTIHMQEDMDTLPYKSVREFVRTVKPAHLAVFLTWAFHVTIDSTQLEQFLHPWMRLHLHVPFWDCRLFDGSWNFDGSVPMDARRLIIMPMRMRFSTAVQNKENIGSATAAIRRNLWFFDGSVKMDGSRKFNAFYGEEEL